jgi:hypothetical protein
MFMTSRVLKTEMQMFILLKIMVHYISTASDPMLSKRVLRLEASGLSGYVGHNFQCRVITKDCSAVWFYEEMPLKSMVR